MYNQPKALIWLRRDLRLEDHVPLYEAVQQGYAVQHVFVFDTTILDPLSRDDRRVSMLFQWVDVLTRRLNALGGSLLVLHGDPTVEIPKCLQAGGYHALFYGQDYEASSQARDAKVKAQFNGLVVECVDHVVKAPGSVRTLNRQPYTVFTPFYKNWSSNLQASDLKDYSVDLNAVPWVNAPESLPMTMSSLGFIPTTLNPMLLDPGNALNIILPDFKARMSQYEEHRDYPSVRGPSYLSTFIRFGAISIRECARTALASNTAGAQTWLKELAWREFYIQWLWHYPKVETHAFVEMYEHIQWPNDPTFFEAWKKGETGYPLVDAGMRQLNQTGYMHNRLRMLTASFLTKHLGVHWKLGERYFAEHLLDFELASNVGGWQWAASTGCDAQPYFRIFNPITQSKKFDAEGTFIRKYCPELSSLSNKDIHEPSNSTQWNTIKNYPLPIISHTEGRVNALNLFKMN